MKQSANYWIEKLQLQRHPEGGWFREIYRSEEIALKECLPGGFSGDRNFSTSIYYLLEGDDFSAFHRIKSDEIWHFYAGSSAIEIWSVQNGRLIKQRVGNNPESGEQFQFVVPKNTWFAARLANNRGFALAGCTVSPGFYFEDFEMADKSLLSEFPAFADEIKMLVKL
jgi:predicted cupin superfamily sugar epimerase